MAKSLEERLAARRPPRGFAEGTTPTVPMSPGAVRLGTRFLPVVALVIPLIALTFTVILGARWLIGTAWYAGFAAAYPAVVPVAGITDTYSPPIRWLHYLNFLIMSLLFRSGIQILADHPRLYWNIHCTPGTEWIRFRGPVPAERVWTAKDDSVALPEALGLPGGRHVIGLARKWHFLDVLAWLAIGVAFYAVLFSTDQWRKLVPTTWRILPGALTTAISYAALRLPGGDGGPFSNALQQLAYFATVFIAAPLSLLTGLAMSPALVNTYAWYQRLFGNRQVARSLHFLLWCYYAAFFAAHVAFVVITNLRGNMNRMWAGRASDTAWTGVVIGALGVLLVAAINGLANWVSWNRPRQLLHVYQRAVGRMMEFAFSRQPADHQYRRRDISPHFWPNGREPTSAEYAALVRDAFRDYRLRVYGDVEHPAELSLEELRALPKREQITLHNCIQGWSGVAEWGGVQLSVIMDIVRPRPTARYAIFYSFGEGGEGGQYYDAHDLGDLRHASSILAYEMNGLPLSMLHGAPLRLRNESQLGFKMVKWVQAVEFVQDYRARFAGEGGSNEDHEYFGYRAEI